MSGVNEFVIPVDKGQLIRQRFYRQIESLFNVRLEFTSDWNTAKRTGNEWIKISGNEQERQKAEEYTKGISNPETNVYFLIPEHLQSRNSWNRDEVIWQIQRESSALISNDSLAKLYIQGSEISVATAISLLEEQVNYASHSQNRLFAPNHQNEIYYPQQVIPPSNPYASNNYGPDIIVAKGAAMVNNQQQRPVIARGASPYNEDHLTEFASKLGYSIEEINTAKSKCTSVVNENSLLQQLMTLFPRKFPHDAPVATNSKVTRDSSQNFEQKIDVFTEEKNIPFPKDNKQNKKESSSESKLRHIVVDGSNVAMSHGNREVFSCKGIMICVNYFKQRGHTEITVFVPHWRKEASKPDRPIVDQQILLDLEKERILAFTPSRRVNGRRVICYDDRYVVKFAAENDGIIVSNDNFRDLEKENPEWKKVIEEKLLMYTFVKDCFMPPDDPLGRHGPKLDEFLKKGTVVQPRLCPYRKKCTYGQKCKFYHPERMEKTAVAVNKNSQAETIKCKNDGNKRPQDIEGQDSVLLLNSGFATNKATEVNSIQQQAKRINTGQLNLQSQQYQNDFQNEIQNMARRSDLSSSSILQQQTRSYGQVLKQQESLQRPTSPATSNPKSAEIMRNLQSMFPNKIDLIRTIMNQNPGETDVSRLVDLILCADIN